MIRDDQLSLLYLTVMWVSVVTSEFTRPEFCSLEAATGLCRGAHTRYHFDAKGDACYNFKYGGCGGNRNNFETREECESVCTGRGGSAVAPPANVQTRSKTDASHCYLQPESGHCKASITQYHYDHTTQRCFQFQYSGCGGNDNRFDTTEACLTNCTKVVDVCQERAEVGRCKAAIPRFHFNGSTRQCQQFIYGGCGGNGNNFETRELCEARCLGAAGSTFNQDGKASKCLLPPEVGLCKALLSRYHYDQSSNTCSNFVYGGCGGNENNFLTREECLEECAGGNKSGETTNKNSQVNTGTKVATVDVCQERAEVGRCKAAIPRFHFNGSTRQCQQFIYGGCGGNGNNFETREQCEARCLGAAGSTFNQDGKVSECLLAPDAGPCKALLSRYHYDQSSDTCSNFVYGGCGGNENNFQTREVCELQCLGRWSRDGYGRGGDDDGNSGVSLCPPGAWSAVLLLMSSLYGR